MTVHPTPAAAVSDLALVAAIRGGDRAAERALFQRHVGTVHRLAFHLAGEGDTADDLVQQVFIRVFEKLGTFRGESAFTTWLHRVTVTTCLNALRQTRRVRFRERPLEALSAPVAAQHHDPAELLALRTAIRELPPVLRAPLVLHALEGHPHGEVARMLGIPEGTSKRRVHEARAALRVALALGEEESDDDD